MSALPLDDDPALDIEPVTAWRVWKLERGQRGRLKLMSVNHPGGWRPGKPVRASCRHGHRAPQPGCTCGLYATTSLGGLRSAGALNYGGSVLGTIAAWGHVVEHAAGVRAELAYPQRLRLVCARCLTGGEMGEPWVVLQGGLGLEALCRRHAGRDATGFPAAMIQAELLSTYAVDLLPAGPIPPPPPLPGHRRKLGMKILIGIGSVIANVVGALFALWAFAGFAFVGVALVWSLVTGALRAVGLMEDEPPPAAAAVSAPDPFEPLAFPRSMPRGPHPQPEPPPQIRMAMVCGVPDGTAIRQVPCDEDFVLMGFASNIVPLSFAESCLRGTESFSRTKNWSVCWTDLRPGSSVDVPARTTTTNPFRGGP